MKNINDLYHIKQRNRSRHSYAGSNGDSLRYTPAPRWEQGIFQERPSGLRYSRGSGQSELPENPQTAETEYQNWPVQAVTAVLGHEEQ